MSSATHIELTQQEPQSPYNRQPMSAESFSSGSQSTSQTLPPPPPGSDFFEQGLMLLKTSSEEPVPEDVEALNLIVGDAKSIVNQLFRS